MWSVNNITKKFLPQKYSYILKNGPLPTMLCYVVNKETYNKCPLWFLSLTLYYFMLVSEWVKVAELVLTLCNPMNYTHTVHGILQARILEWVAFPLSRGSSQPRDQTQVSHIAGQFFTSWREGKPYVGKEILNSS